MLTILEGNCLATLPTIPDASVQMCATSPPYFGLRDYGNTAQIGLEPTPAEYVAKMVKVFSEVRRVLKDDGTLWLNLGDSYASNGGRASGFTESRHQYTTNSPPPPQGRAPTAPGFKPKDMIGIPWRVAFALQEDGWWLRSDIIWAKPNSMPESVTDRPTRAHEYIFLLSKSPRYYYNAEAIKEPCIGGADGHGGTEARKSRHKPDGKCFPTDTRNGMRPEKQRGHGRRHVGFNDRWDAMERDEQCSGMRNKRDVWTVAPANYPEAHFATWPKALVLPMILAGSQAGDTVLDPFFGSGTTGEVAIENGRRCIGCELNPDYIALARQRCETTIGLPLRS